MIKIWQWIKVHPSLILLVPVDAYVAGGFFWSVTAGAEDVIRWALVLIGVLIVIVKVELAGDRTKSGFILWLIAALLNSYAAVGFITSHASRAVDVPDTIEIRTLKAEVDRANTALKYTDSEIAKAIKENRLSLLNGTLNPQKSKDLELLTAANTAYELGVQRALKEPPDAVTVLSRPVVLIQQGTYGSIALLVFGIAVSFFIEGVTRRSMVKSRGPSLLGITQPLQDTTTTIEGKNIVPYPRDFQGVLVAPIIAAQLLGLKNDEAKELYKKALKEEVYNETV